MTPYYIMWCTRPIASRVRQVVYTSPAKPTVTTITKASHRPVGGKTLQRLVHVAPVQLFGAKKKFYQYLRRITGFSPNIWPGPRPRPSNGPSHSLSWTFCVTPFVLLSGRHRYHGRKLKFQRCFGYVLQWLHQVDPKGFFDVSNTFLMPSSGWNKRA